MENQNHLYLSKLKKTKYSLEKSLNDLEQYDLDEESIRVHTLDVLDYLLTCEALQSFNRGTGIRTFLAV